MPEYFGFDRENKIYVNGVRNFLVQAENAQNRKEYPPVFHVVYALLCAMVTYLAFDGQHLGFSSVVCAFLLCLSPAMYVFSYLYSNIALKLISTFLPAAAFAARLIISDTKITFESIAPTLFMYILCILVAATLTKVSLSAYTKSTCFLLVAVIYFVIFLCISAFLLISATGSCSLPAAVNAIDGVLDKSINATMEYAMSEEGLSQINLMVSASEGITSEQLLSTLKEGLEMTASAAKSGLPSAIVLTCMLFAFVTVELFSVFVRIFKIDVFVCIMDSFWSYRLSRATTMMYDIVFFAYILGMFISFPGVFNVAVANLLLIMTPVVFIPGVKSIHGFFARKKMKRTSSVLLTLVVIVAAVMLTGTLGIYIISSIGVTYVVTREIQETMLFPSKFAADCQEYKTRYGKDMPDINSTTVGNDNTEN